MLCKKCGFSNNYGSNYCEKCGEKFLPETKKAEYDETVWAKIETIEDEYNKMTLKKITDHFWFKIAVIAIVLAIGIYKILSYGTDLRVVPKDSYQVSYNQSANEYYVKAKDDNLDLELYVPLYYRTVQVLGYDSKGEILLDETIKHSELEENAPYFKQNTYDTIKVNAIAGDSVRESMTIKCLR